WLRQNTHLLRSGLKYLETAKSGLIIKRQTQLMNLSLNLILFINRIINLFNCPFKFTVFIRLIIFFAFYILRYILLFYPASIITMRVFITNTAPNCSRT